jgi:hypothetical protein
MIHGRFNLAAILLLNKLEFFWCVIYYLTYVQVQVPLDQNSVGWTMHKPRYSNLTYNLSLQKEKPYTMHYFSSLFAEKSFAFQ